jgi:ABC-type glycerol-3-phosphate transport system permease component
MIADTQKMKRSAVSTTGRRSASLRWGRLSRHVFLTLVTVAILFPIIWIVMFAFKSEADAWMLPTRLFPRQWVWNNFTTVVRESPELKSSYMNSVQIVVVCLPIMVCMTALAGYAFARVKFPGRDAIFWALVATMFFPLDLSRMFTIFELTNTMGLRDTKLGLILPYLSIGLVMNTFIMRSVFAEIPKAIEDSARVDGASDLQTFVRVMLPMARSGLIVVALLAFLAIWGEYLFASIITLRNAQTLSIALVSVGEYTGGGRMMTLTAAGYVLGILPPLLLYVFLQKYFVMGLIQGMKF